MRTRTVLLSVGASLLLAVGVVLRLWADGAAPASDPGPAAVRPAAPPRLGAGDRSTARVERELTELRAEVARLGDAPGPAEVMPPALAPQEQQARDDQRVAAQAALLAQTFAADVRDPSWSPQTESSLREAFAAAALPGARLEHVACGATLCRYTVAFDSIERRDEGIAKVVGLVRWDALGFGDASPEDPLRYIVYASRDPDSFPAAL